MPINKLDGNRITDWDGFHDVFAEEFQFPDYYGRNMNAWIDCMSDLGDSSSEIVAIHIDHVDHVNTEVLEALIDCVAFVNWRFTEKGHRPILALSYNRTPVWRRSAS